MNTIKNYAVLTRAYVGLMFFGEVGLIATALYITFNPVESNGYKGRSMFPLMYSLLL